MGATLQPPTIMLVGYRGGGSGDGGVGA